MYDSVMQAFQSSSQPFAVELEAERKKVTQELIADAITKDHPKVKDIVAEACSSLQEKMHGQREQHLREVFAVEKQVQELQFRLQSRDKELEGLRHELSTALRKQEQTVSVLK